MLALLSSRAAPTALAAAVAAALLLVLRELSRPRQTRRATGEDLPVPPTTLPLLGNLVDLLRHNDALHDYLLANARRFHPSPFVLRAPGRPDLVVVSTPQALEDVEQTHFAVFGKGDGIRMRLEELLGDSLVVVDGSKWRLQRKILARLFSARALRDDIARVIRADARELLAILRVRAAPTKRREDEAEEEEEEEEEEEARYVDLSTLMGRFTLEVFVEVGFGLKLGALAAGEASAFERAFDRAQYICTARYTQPTALWKLKRWLGLGIERELPRCIRVIDETAVALIQRAMARHEERARRGDAVARGDEPERLDIVSMAIAAIASDNERRRRKRKRRARADESDADESDAGESDAGESGEEEETPLDATLLRSLAISALVAGRDTTAQTFCWFIHALSTSPAAARALRAELRAALPALAADADWIPTSDDVQALPFLEACVRETLRLFPAAALNARVASRDAVLSDGTFLAAGASVAWPAYAMGRLPALWGDDAAEFRPERWIAADGSLVAVSPFKWNAFLAGPRMCVGRSLAMLELKLLIAATVARFHFSPRPGLHVTYQRSISLPMREPFMVAVEPVHAA